MIVELSTHKVKHVCRGGKAHQYRARKRSIFTVKIEEQKKKKLTFCVAYEKYDFKFYSNHVFFPPFPFFSKTTGLFINKKNISAKFQCYCRNLLSTKS